MELFIIYHAYSLKFQFDAVENGMHTSKMMQVFSKQAPMMDALISHFAEQMRRRKLGENGQPPEIVAEGKFQILYFKLNRHDVKIECIEQKCIYLQNQIQFKTMAVAF